MKKTLLALLTTFALTAPMTQALAIQCVPYAREVSGINLKGDAWQWWHAAAGVYDRGTAPKSSAILVFNRQGSMSYGHVSVVNRVISNRLVLVDHANWAPARTAGRGEVTRSVPVLDVSPRNDWSQVRVWFQPANDFGHRIYRTEGFVYNPNQANPHKPNIQNVALSATSAIKESETAKAKQSALSDSAVKPGKPHGAAKVEVIVLSTPDEVVTAAAEAAVAEHNISPPTTDGLVTVARTLFRPRVPAANAPASADSILFN